MAAQQLQSDDAIVRQDIFVSTGEYPNFAGKIGILLSGIIVYKDAAVKLREGRLSWTENWVFIGQPCFTMSTWASLYW